MHFKISAAHMLKEDKEKKYNFSSFPRKHASLLVGVPTGLVVCLKSSVHLRTQNLNL